MYPNVTRQSLLERMKEGDENAWQEFYEQYRSLVWLKGSDYGLTETEQQDLLIEVMLDFFNVQGKFQYDPSKGKFRFYFRKLVVARCLKIIKKRTPIATDDIDIERIPVETIDDDYEYKAFLFRRALKEVERTMESTRVQCFKRCKIEGESPVNVAADLEISLATAYNYCNDIMEKLKVLVKVYFDQDE